MGDYRIVKLIPAPPDLAALIDTYRAAETTAARIAAHYALMRWPGWLRHKRVVYCHGRTRVALIWGSLKMEDSDAQQADAGI